MKNFLRLTLLTLILPSFLLTAQVETPTPTLPSPTPSTTVATAPAPTVSPAPAAVPDPTVTATPDEENVLHLGSDGHGVTFNFGTGDKKDKTMDVGHSSWLEEGLVPLAAIVFSLGGPIFIIVMILLYRMRKNRLLHETIQKLIASGQPIPPELLASSGAKAAASPARDFRNGIILCAVGLGLIGFFASKHESYGVGFIPLAIGLGFLITAKFAPANGKN